MRARINYETSEVKTGRIEQACARYGLGKRTMRRIAEDAGAVIKIGTCVLINFTLVDIYMDSISM